MRVLTNLSTQTKLFLVFGLLSLLAVAIGLLGIGTAARLGGQVAGLRAGATALENTLRAQADLTREQLAYKNALLSDDLADWTEAYDYAGRLDDFLYTAEFNAASDAEAQVLDEIDALREQYYA